MTIRQKALISFGAITVLAGVLIPSGWFVPLSNRTPLPPPPLSGHALVQAALFVEGLVLIWLGVRRRDLTGTGLHWSLGPQVAVEPPGERRVYGWLLAAVTLLALALRAVALDSDLWLDELTPISAYGSASAWQVAITYHSSNNHLLNTLLVKAAMAVFGEREWAIRLPAMLWGTATIPVLYWTARQALSRHASLCAALLLAVSYHHIFFSQNARGYTAYVCLSLISSVLLVKGLSENRSRVWAAYVVTAVLNFAALLISGFVFAAHIIVGGLAVFGLPSRTGERAQAFRRLFSVFAVTALLGFQLYAAVLPQMYVLMQVVYTEPTSGFSPFSLEFLAEVARGLGAGFGTGLLLGAIPLLCLAGAGYVILVRRHWVLGLALTLPCILQALLLVVQGFTFSPRFFILALPLAILVAVQAIASAAEIAARSFERAEAVSWWGRTVAVLLLSAASVAALPPYYQVPKQAYRASLAHVEAMRQPDGIVIEVHYVQAGLGYYRRRVGIAAGNTYFQARTVDALDAILAEHPGRPVWLVTTFPRALRMGVPDLDARIRRDWEVDRRFPGTIGDGDILIWRQK